MCSFLSFCSTKFWDFSSCTIVWPCSASCPHPWNGDCISSQIQDVHLPSLSWDSLDPHPAYFNNTLRATSQGPIFYHVVTKKVVKPPKLRLIACLCWTVLLCTDKQTMVPSVCCAWSGVGWAKLLLHLPGLPLALLSTTGGIAMVVFPSECLQGGEL